MADLYIAVDGVARRASSAYIGKDSVARNICNGYIGVDNVARKFFPGIVDGEYGSKVIAGTKTKGSFVRFDGKDWIVANVSGNTYTLMLKKMTETTTFGSSSTYSGSTIASKCTTFQNAMSAEALSVVNSKYVQGVTAKVWIARQADITSWTDSNYQTSSAWSGIRMWTANDGVYDSAGAGNYWCSDPGPFNNVMIILSSGYLYSSNGASDVRGFRPCIEVVQ